MTKRKKAPKEQDDQLESPSYMSMRLDLDGKEAVYLRIPTFWDAVNNQWICALKTPKTKKIIKASGKDSFDLQNNFNVEFSKAFHSELSDELFEMFKPLSYWEEKDKLKK